jgi:RimJ/RimL family protein N-acetyltransferase
LALAAGIAAAYKTIMTIDQAQATAAATLIGEHVRLEPLAPSHLDGIMRAGEDDAIWQWLPYRPRTRDEYAGWLDDALRAAAAGEQAPFATIDARTGEVAGSTRLFFVSPRDRRIEIGGTWLAPQAQRTAINTESKLLLLSHCFEALGAVRVELKTDARNERSRAAIARIGARYEGVMRKHMLTRGGIHRDSVYFAIVDDDWPAVRARLEGMLGR